MNERMMCTCKASSPQFPKHRWWLLLTNQPAEALKLGPKMIQDRPGKNDGCIGTLYGYETDKRQHTGHISV